MLFLDWQCYLGLASRAVLGNAAHDEQQFEAVVRTARVLLAEGKVQEASLLARRSMAAFGCKDRCAQLLLAPHGFDHMHVPMNLHATELPFCPADGCRESGYGKYCMGQITAYSQHWP